VTHLEESGGMLVGRPEARRPGALCECEGSPPGVVVSDEKGKYCGGCGGEFPGQDAVP